MSPGAFEDSVVGTIGSGGPGMVSGKLQRLPRIWTLSRSVEMSCLLCLRMVWEAPGMAPGRLQTPQEMVVDLECPDTIRGTLEGDRMYMVDPRSESSCDPVRSVSDKIVCGQIRLFDRRAEKRQCYVRCRGYFL